MSIRQTTTISCDDAFGHWLAGFADGEGSFVVTPTQRGCYRFMFQLRVRDDDAGIIEEIATTLGIGRVYRYKASARAWKSKPTAEWKVYRQDECLALVEFFDRFPLRAKKARDFAIWREAVLAWAAAEWTTERRPDNVGKRGGRAPKDWTRVASLHRELLAARTYEEATA